MGSQPLIVTLLEAKMSIDMLYVTAIISGIFLAISYILTEDNARYLLSGYNTMSAEKRARVDIKNYIRFFKDFHRKLSITLFLGTLGLWLISQNWASVFMVTYPLLAYVYFLWRGHSYYSKADNSLATYIPMGILLVVTLVIGLTTIRDLKENELILEDNILTIKGSFGLTLQSDDIQDIRLVAQWPAVSYKVRGFAAGYVAKGLFKTEDKEVVHLFIDKRYDEALRLDTFKGVIYYNTEPSMLKRVNAKIMTWKAENANRKQN
ncbi:DUF3784 domain-containing protein [Dyadobacter tibetensis]|uniref:DUF3784 domain-containing protein n=1 Tax=Dyadobacter tibetensis TaxID=1211851 RepID=UPI00046F80B6|nr:DUF3784 domain-containing protein [Dyadobacter tibetensis]